MSNKQRTYTTDVQGTYILCDVDGDSEPKYYGYQRQDGFWYIQKETTSGDSSYRYAAGTDGYATNWTNRASLNYDYPEGVFE